MGSPSHITPYNDLALSKKEQVRKMFNTIAPRYDFMNRLLTFRIDIRWRRKAVKLVKKYNPSQIIDIATGTGDFAIELARLSPKKIIGIDIAETMLEIGKKKIRRKGLDKIIELQEGDSEALKFPDNTFDIASSAFGVRNFENLEKGLSEMLRVLKPGGRILILEASNPDDMPFKGLYNLFMKRICPAIGGLFSENKAYDYLNRSVEAFPTGKAFISILNKIGFIEGEFHPVTMGVATIYIGKKQGIEK